MNTRLTHLSSALAGAVTVGLLSWTGDRSGPPLDLDVSVLRELTQHLSVEYVDDHAGGLAKTLCFSGVNVRIVNGLGATNGNPANPLALGPNQTTTNSVGNLLLGYGEPQASHGQPGWNVARERTGSHNLILGTGHGFSSFGALVVGDGNRSLAPHASVVGGSSNKSRGTYAAILAGDGNTADGKNSACVAGYQNQASASNSFTGGGRHNSALVRTSTVVGGSANRATGWLSTVAGGAGNEAKGQQSAISGGFDNLATGRCSTVNGGELNTASGEFSSVAFGHRRKIEKANSSGNTDHDGVAGSIWEDN